MKDSGIKKFVAAYKAAGPEYYYRYLDEAILWLCKRYPGHTSAEEVYAKITLVNRAYRANLHMSRREAEWKLAEALVSGNIDEVLSPLKKIKRFDFASYPVIIDTHKKFVSVARTALKRGPVSFCSKYLSFHFPGVVPIYDKRSYDTAWALTESKLADKEWKTDYECFCASMLELIEALKKAGVADPKLKLVDFVLYDKLNGKV